MDFCTSAELMLFIKLNCHRNFALWLLRIKSVCVYLLSWPVFIAKLFDEVGINKKEYKKNINVSTPS